MISLLDGRVYRANTVEDWVRDLVPDAAYQLDTDLPYKLALRPVPVAEIHADVALPYIHFKDRSSSQIYTGVYVGHEADLGGARLDWGREEYDK